MTASPTPVTCPGGSVVTSPQTCPSTGVSRFASLTAGFNHSCGLDASGQAWCWGYDVYGELGDGDTTGGSKLSPVAVVGGHTFTSLTADNVHSCGLDTSGQAWCWGYDQVGQLGDGDTTGTSAANKFSPVAVVGGHTFTSLTAGSDHSCGLVASGQTWCWGYDGYGELGDGDTTGASKFIPVAMV